jgi:hypothetical protein
VVRLDLALADKSDWLKIFDPRDATVFVATDAPPAVGDAVRLDLVVGADGPKVILRGKVISRRTIADGALASGFSVALDAEEREKVSYLTGFVRGGLLDLRERRRLPLRFVVSYSSDRGDALAHTRDVNEEGLFIVTESPLPERTALRLFLTVPVHEDPIALTGVVSHTVVVDDDDVPGMGIRLTFAGNEAEAFARVIDELEARFNQSALGDQHLL